MRISFGGEGTENKLTESRVREVKSATIALLNRCWEENYKNNFVHISKSPGVSRLTGRFKDIPALLVGAGPSLDKNVRLLRLVKGKAVIISCDAALKILLGHGVTPDIVVNLDPQSVVLNFFDGVETRNMTLIAPTIALPALRSEWRGNLFYYSKHAPDIPLLAQIAQKHVKHGILVPGGSVLSVAFDFAFKTGADPIAFIGQDLSYPTGNAYASGSHFGDYSAKSIIDTQGDNIVEENDLFGRKLKTQKSMSVTKQWFGWAFKTWNQDRKRKIFNCSESGILTECPTKTLSEFVNRHCSRKVNIAWIIKKAAKPV
ncbi:MAG: hypothetical protein IEMM0002_1513 [bacterium]|nr:MAG: hypothetical protein IEMM0002_1513 [bacterium]